MGALLSLNSQITKGRFGLGHDPTYKEIFQASREKKKKCVASRMSIPHIRATLPAPVEVIIPKPFKELEDKEFYLACIIRLYPEEFSMNTITSSDDDLTSTIRPGMLGKMAGLWTIEPCFVVAPTN